MRQSLTALLITAMCLTTASPAPVLAQDDTAATSPADEAWAPLASRFENLYRSLQNAGGLSEDDRPIVEATRGQFEAFVADFPDDPRGPAAVLQLSMWLGDEPAIERAYRMLTTLRPGDAGLSLSWANQCIAANRYDEALVVLEAAEIDLDAMPDAALVLSDCLAAQHRFEEAVSVLESLGDETLAASPLIQSQVNSVLPLRKELLELWAEEQVFRAAEAEADDLPRIIIEVPGGQIEIELFENEHPNTVANFISLAESDYYAGTLFHRVIPNFMVQGGDSYSRPGHGGIPGQGTPGYQLADEHTGEVYRKHFSGSVAMAKRTEPDTAGSQFFITHLPTPHLNGKHTVFGRVTDGLDVARAIKPDDEIISVTIVRKRDHEYVPETLPDVGATTEPEG